MDNEYIFITATPIATKRTQRNIYVILCDTRTSVVKISLFKVKIKKKISKS